jgi:hypothetical protein
MMVWRQYFGAGMWRRSVLFLGILTLHATGGCFLENIDANKNYAYVLKKGSPAKITRWTLAQHDIRRIGHGTDALQDILNGHLTDVLHGDGDSERLLREVDEAMNGIVEVYRRCIATAEGSSPPSERFETPAGDADGLVRWIIPYYASHAINANDSVPSRKYRELYAKLEPARSSKYFDLWARSRDDARLHFEIIHGSDSAK